MITKIIVYDELAAYHKNIIIVIHFNKFSGLPNLSYVLLHVCKINKKYFFIRRF